jgi:long-chain acyl-CoA synthetase
MKTLPRLTLPAAFERTVSQHADRPAFGFVGEEPMTYREFGQRVRGVAAMLHERGIGKGDKVAILGENMPNWGIAYFATAILGAVAVPILQEFHESAISHIITHSEAKALVASDKLLAKVDPDQHSDLQTIVRMDDLELLTGSEPLDRLRETVIAGRARLERLMEQARRYRGIPAPEVEEDDTAAIIYTSGTTGHSKGVILSHKNIVYDAAVTAELVSFTPEERMVSMLPLAHTYECTLGLVIPVFFGSAVFYLKKPPTPRTLLPAMQEVKPTFVLMVPLIIEKIYKNRVAPKFKGSAFMRNIRKLGAANELLCKAACRKLEEALGGNLKCVCIGGAPLATEVEQFLRAGGFPYSVGYGMSETSPMVTGADPKVTRFRSCGPPVPGVEVRIDNPRPGTDVGEILIKGPIVMQGYYKAPRLTEETLQEGWLRTGDLGNLDADGYLYIRGRSKNVVLGPSGENIYPEEIESVINQNEYVIESLVYRQDGKLTARVHLNYELLEQGPLKSRKLIESDVRAKVLDLLETIRQEANKTAANFAKVVQIIEHTEPFEKTPTQKIKRYLYVDPEENGIA